MQGLRPPSVHQQQTVSWTGFGDCIGFGDVVEELINIPVIIGVADKGSRNEPGLSRLPLHACFKCTPSGAHQGCLPCHSLRHSAEQSMERAPTHC